MLKMTVRRFFKLLTALSAKNILLRYIPFAERFLLTIREKTLGLILATESQSQVRQYCFQKSNPAGYTHAEEKD
jgi:hypothetical protein